MTGEKQTTLATGAKTVLVEKYLGLWDKARAPGSSREDSEALGGMMIDHKAELLLIEAKAKAIYSEDAWNRDLSAGRLTTEKIFSLWRQAAAQMDNQ